MLQNTKLLVKGNRSLIFENIYDYGSDFYFTEFNYNALFKLDRNSWNVEYIGMIPGEDFLQERLYISTVLYNEKMYFAPYSAKEIAVFDLKENKFEKIEIVAPRKNNDLNWENAKFHKLVSIKDILYFIPDQYPGVLCYNTKTETFYLIDDWVDKIEKKRSCEWGYFFESIVIEDKLILPCTCADAILIININTQKSEVILSSKENRLQYKYCGICYVDGYFYLLSSEGTILKRRLESETENVEIVKIPLAGENNAIFHPVGYLDGYIYLFPLNREKGYRVNIKSKQITEIKMINHDNGQVLQEEFPLLLAKFDNDKIYAVSRASSCFIEYDVNKKIAKKIKLYPQKDIQCFIEKNIIKILFKKACDECLVENRNVSLYVLLRILKEYDNHQKENQKVESYKTENKIYNILIG